MHLKEKIGKIPYLLTIRALAKEINSEVYLVGGVLRDIYLGKQINYFDFDFIIRGDAFDFAYQFSKRTGSRLIVLDEKERVYRVISKRNKGYNYDFATLRGPTLKEDLLNRDFSINTLCIKVNDWPYLKVIDYFGARKDLEKKLIRVLNEKVLVCDPLRLLRAFSLSARYDLKIESRTLSLLRKYRGLLRKVSGERINEELFKILDSLYSYPVIKKMSDSLIIDEFIPYIKESRGLFQGAYHHLDVWAHSLETLMRFEIVYRRRLAKDTKIVDYLNQELVKNRRRIHILKLACLVHDIGKPLAQKVVAQKTIFHTHERIGTDLAEKLASRLKLSFKEKESLKKMIFWHLRPGYLANEVTPSPRAIYRFFRDTDKEGVAIILLSLADWRATRGPLTDEKRRARHERVMFGLIEKYFKQEEAKPLPKIVDGHDIMKKFKLEPSPLVGKILKKIKEEQALGKVSTKKEAYLIAEKIVKKHG
jgi:tRNA nucleotidyltransferase/poly(A) polymerase